MSMSGEGADEILVELGDEDPTVFTAWVVSRYAGVPALLGATDWSVVVQLSESTDPKPENQRDALLRFAAQKLMAALTLAAERGINPPSGQEGWLEYAQGTFYSEVLKQEKNTDVYKAADPPEVAI